MSSSFPGHQNFNQTDGIARGVYAQNPVEGVQDDAAPTAISPKDTYILARGAGAYLLPYLPNTGQGKEFVIANRSGGEVTVSPDANDTAAGRGIEGAGGIVTLQDGQTVTLRAVTQATPAPTNAFWRIDGFVDSDLTATAAAFGTADRLLGAPLAVTVTLAGTPETVAPLANGLSDANGVVTADDVAGTMTANEAGTYRAEFEAIITAGAAGDVPAITLMSSVQGVLAAFGYTAAVLNTPVSVAMTKVVALSAGEVISAEIDSDTDGDVVTFNLCSLNLERVS